MQAFLAQLLTPPKRRLRGPAACQPHQLATLGISLTHSPDSLNQQHALEWGTNHHVRDLICINTRPPPPITINKVIKITNVIKVEKSSHCKYQTSTSEESGLITRVRVQMVDFPPPGHMKKEQLPRKYIMYSSLITSKIPSDLIFSSLVNT